MSVVSNVQIQKGFDEIRYVKSKGFNDTTLSIFSTVIINMF